MTTRNRKVPKTEGLSLRFKALADPTRRALLAELAAGPRPVGELAAGFQMSRPAVSKHLKLLRQAGLVEERRRGRENLHRLRPGLLEPLARWLEELAAAGAAAPGRHQVEADSSRRPPPSRSASSEASPGRPHPSHPIASSDALGDDRGRLPDPSPCRPPGSPPADTGEDWRCW